MIVFCETREMPACQEFLQSLTRTDITGQLDMADKWGGIEKWLDTFLLCYSKTVAVFELEVDSPFFRSKIYIMGQHFKIANKLLKVYKKKIYLLCCR